MENTDPRYVRSRLKLRAALLELAEEDPSRLTVSVVCERTGIDRATFYRHFDGIDALVEDTLGSLFDAGANEWTAVSRGTGDQVEESTAILTAYFENIVQHWGLYRWALGPEGSARVIYSMLAQSIDGVAAELEQVYGSDDDTLYRAWFLGGGLLGSLLHWLQTETPEREPADLARWILATSLSTPSLSPTA